MFNLLSHALESHARNLKLISFFSVPFLVAFPLSLLLPNFIALSGTFLRFQSIEVRAFTAVDALTIGLAFFASLLLFSFAVVAINVVIRAQRTLNRLTTHEIEKIEECTLKLFFILSLAFAVIFLANLALIQAGFSANAVEVIGLVVAFAVASTILFVPQALVLEDLSMEHAVKRSISTVLNKFPLFLFYLVTALALLALNTSVFLYLQSSVETARFLAIIVNSLLILPFLEVLKVQVYLSKYTIL